MQLNVWCIPNDTFVVTRMLNYKVLHTIVKQVVLSTANTLFVIA